MAAFFGSIDGLAAGFVHDELLGVNLVLEEVFHVGVAEVAQAAVQGEVGGAYVGQLHAHERLPGEVQAGGGRGYAALMAGINGLEVLQVAELRLAFQIVGYGASPRERTVLRNSSWGPS